MEYVITNEKNQQTIDIMQVALASCAIGLAAQIKIPLFFTPVPLTIQTLAVMLIGAFLGSKKGTLAAFAYLAQGWLGLPVWAGGGSGILHFFGPTGGYLAAYLVQAFVIGWLLERGYGNTFPKVFGILLFSIALQLSLGSLWLAQFVGISNCLSLGFTPFILGESAKALFITFFLRSKK